MSLARTSGFTLVELMVVMVIIGIMSIVIMTVYTSVTSLSATLSAQRILASTARDIVDRISTDMQEQKILAYTSNSTWALLYTDEYANLYTGSGNRYIGFANHLYILAQREWTTLKPCTGTGCYVYKVNDSDWGNAVNIVDTFVPDEAKKRVHIDDMRWYVSGDGGNSGEQKVTLVMRLSLTRYSGASYSVIRDTHLDIQTTISSRGTRK